MNSLIKFWRDLDTTSGKEKLYIHPNDLDVMSKYRDKFYYHENSDKYNSDDHKHHIHVNLLPSPYTGDLENAKVYLFMLNPGFGGQEYIDHSNAAIWDTVSKSIRQEFSSNRYLEQHKFFFLHPELKETAGGKYINAYFKTCIKKYQEETNMSIEDVLKVFANNICFIQAFPYHSEKFNGRLNTITHKLPSHKAAKDFVMSISKDPHKLIFIVRGYRFFDHQIHQHANMIPFTKVSEYGVKYFPVNQEYHDLKHGDRLVNHLLKSV